MFAFDSVQIYGSLKPNNIPSWAAPRIAKDEKAVSAVQNLIDSWNNPFTENQNVVSISTAKEVPDY